MEYRIEEYIDSNGQSPYAKWFASLNAAIDFGPGYRIYLAKSGKELIILFGGGTKKTQQNDIKKAQALLKEYKQRKKLEK